MPDKTFTFIHEKSPVYFESTISNVEGGSSPNGLFKIFLIENIFPLPNIETFIDEGEGFKLKETDKPDHIIKNVKGELTIAPYDMPYLISSLQSMYNIYIKGKGGKDDKQAST